MSTSAHLATLDRIAKQAREARVRTAERVAMIRSDDTRTAEYRQDESNRLRAELRSTIDRLSAECRTARQHLDGADRIEDDRPADTQMLDDSRRARAWDRARAEMESGRPWRAVADDAVAEGDTATLAALADELPRYVARTGVPEGASDRRARIDAAITTTRTALDPIVSAHGTGVHQKAAQIRHTTAAAVQAATRELSAAEMESFGRFAEVAMAYAVEGRAAGQEAGQ